MSTSLRAVKGYWTAQPMVDGKRRTWTLGAVSDVSEDRARVLLNERLNSHRGPNGSNLISVEVLIESYLDWAKRTYIRPDDGTPTGEANNLMYGLQPFSDLFGAMPALEVRPRHLKRFVSEQVKAEVSRQTINKRLGMIKRWLKWGAGDADSIPAETYATCSLFSSVKRGRDGAKDAPKIGAVPMATVEQTLPHLPPTVQAMIRLQIATAMRPEEVCALRPVDLDMRKTPWVYVPEWHKNKHRGQQRRIYFGPAAREVLAPLLKRAIHLPVFSPKLAMAERRGKQPRKRIGDCYDTRSYRKAIWYACDKAFPAPVGVDAVKWRRKHRWSPNRLRKLALDNVEREHGKQAAKACAGHTRVETTVEHYLTQDDSLAMKIAEKAG